MANYSVTNTTALAGTAQAAVGTSYNFLLLDGNSSLAYTQPTSGPQGLRRGKLYDLLIGTNTTPADNYLEFSVARATVGTTVAWVGSVSSVSTGYVIDPGDAGGLSALIVMNASATSSTVANATTETWYVGINQRASYRWVAAPGSEIVRPAVSSATAGAGLMLRVRSGAYTGTATATWMIQEQ